MILAETKTKVWLKLSSIHQKLVQFYPNPLKYVTICCSHFGLLSVNRNPYFGRNRNFTETPNFGQYRKRNFGLSLCKRVALVSHHSVFRSYNPPFLGFLFDFVITMLASSWTSALRFMSSFVFCLLKIQLHNF